MNKRTAICLLVCTALLGGCGSGDGDYANNPRPPAPINVAAAITDDGITVSPRSFGAGPVVFIIANQTDVARQITLESDTSEGPGIRQTTSKISPDGTATLKVDLTSGDYEVTAGGGSLKPAAVKVGPLRESAQNELLQP